MQETQQYIMRMAGKISIQCYKERMEGQLSSRNSLKCLWSRITHTERKRKKLILQLSTKKRMEIILLVANN
jgi:hypothetical protein